MGGCDEGKRFSPMGLATTEESLFFGTTAAQSAAMAGGFALWWGVPFQLIAIDCFAVDLASPLLKELNQVLMPFHRGDRGGRQTSSIFGL